MESPPPGRVAGTRNERGETKPPRGAAGRDHKSLGRMGNFPGVHREHAKTGICRCAGIQLGGGHRRRRKNEAGDAEEEQKRRGCEACEDQDSAEMGVHGRLLAQSKKKKGDRQVLGSK